jgi:hypothetical protein
MDAPAGFSRSDAGTRPLSALPVDPIAWLAAEIARHRKLCDTLAHTAGMPAAAPALLRRLAAELATDMTLQLADEADDLFPRLRARVEADDDIARVLGILTADHEAEQAAARDLQLALVGAANAGVGPAAWPGLATTIGQFVAHERRHGALVHAVLLPIARLRLTPDDQLAMARSMAARRGH